MLRYFFDSTRAKLTLLSLFLLFALSFSLDDATCSANDIELDHSCKCHFSPNSQITDPYLSRHPNKLNISICPREHPSVWYNYSLSTMNNYTNSEYKLSFSQLEFYDKNGYLLLPNFFNKSEINDYLTNLNENLNDLLKTKENIIYETPKNEAIKSIFEIHKHSTLKGLLLNKRIVSYVKQILNSDVYISQSRLNFQSKFDGNGFPWHSDFETWHCEDGVLLPRMLSAVIYLDNVYPFNGGLMIIPKSHKYFISTYGSTPDKNWDESLQNQLYGRPSNIQLECIYNKSNIKYMTSDIGSVLIFDSNLIHGSHTNISPLQRKNLFFVFNSINNKPKNKPFCAVNIRPERVSTRDPKWTKAIKI